jgi:RimJ/RimL family protein N-acetyltransferase
MGNEVIIREALLEDVDGIIDALEPVAAEGRFIASEAPVDRERFRAAFSGTIAAPQETIFVAVCDGRIVGSLGLRRAFGGPAELGMSLVAEHRGHGIGARMMERAIAWARAHNYHKLELSVYPWNEAALALYEKLGFEREGYLKKHVRRRNGELWDVVAMGLLL